MRLSDFSVKRPVAITMVFLAILLLGAVSWSKLKMDLLPQLNLPMAIAITSYEGVGPEEMESLVTRPIEEAFGTVNGVKNINSISSKGNSLVYVEFVWGTDMNFAMSQMREKLDLLDPVLPQDANKPMLFKMDINMMPVMVLGVGGDIDLVSLDKLASEVIKPRLERVSGVASVDVVGGVQREIRISAEPQRLQAYNLSLDNIVSSLRMENRDTSAGTIEEGLKEHIVRVTGEFDSIQEIEELLIPLASGGKVRLAELARVEDTFHEQTQFVYMNGTPCVEISIQKQSDANTIEVSEAVHAEIEKLKAELPAGTDFVVGLDQASYIRMSIDTVTNNALLGASLAILILFLFLRTLRSTLVIAVAIPISIIATFILLYFGGLTLNVVSLGGLALGVGMMVDNSIVILENIYRHRQEGWSRLEAAKAGAHEVSSAVIASTLTTIAVFLPIVYVEGLASQVFRPLALTVSFSLLASLIVALTLVPMLSSKVLKVERNTRRKNPLFELWGKALSGLETGYRALLVWAINHKKTVIGTTAILFLISCGVMALVGMEFLPKQDTGQYTINITLPNGTAVRETQRVTDLVVKYIQEAPEHEWCLYAVGTGGNVMSSTASSESAMVMGQLVSKAKRTRSIDEVLDEIRKKCNSIPGAKIEILGTDMSMITSLTPIQINITGDNLDVLTAFADTVAEKVKAVEGVREVKTSLEDGRPELVIKINREKAAHYGLNSTQLSSFLSTSISGTTATKYRKAGEEVDVRVMLDERYRSNLNELAALTIVSPTGALVPLSDIATLSQTTGPTQIVRENQSRQVTVTGQISGRDLASVIRDIQASLSGLSIPYGVQMEYSGANEEMIEAFQDLALALILAILLVYMILAAQFEGLWTPFIIMFALPPTLIGVAFSLFFMGQTLNVPSFIGVIMLAGIVVNNAIVLVDYINTLRERDGMSCIDAVLKAGPIRLRPILMTTLTTVLALIPTMFATGEGAELSASMASAVAGGLTFSTLITLVLVPCVYILFDNARMRFRRRRRQEGTEKPLAGVE